MNCAVAAYALAAGVPPDDAVAVLWRALGPQGAYAPTVGSILTRRGWSWHPGPWQPHLRTCILTWDGHYGAVVNGVAYGNDRGFGLHFLGCWVPPEAAP